jgi:hypothetical protein
MQGTTGLWEHLWSVITSVKLNLNNAETQYLENLMTKCQDICDEL